MLKEHDRAVLTDDLPTYHLKVGDVGVIVHVYSTGRAYEVEFFTLNGQTLDVVTVEAWQLRPITQSEVMHARPLEVAAA